ncbi:23S rRNA (pseudouridine(1915)-N(3))-methyltransferase RlmH [Robiginitalea sp. M366]|uniref:23S rRNA (pseudouridine(1915)-N(3))-methyltransferase RlmH n=1 Tax=Robiginitalea aestuariiviva TaxID=3036903 RepID=UPI00240E07F0|nr:23S rRNA (pseudouridine(1915)-N(3))-methyltransferase RlmH [Robiginitalea aestuariiviva]MDG1573514.1 23S rRNA (pseudouridine(1915)-N(3))-methyltransferase RlmH [Robiginitalea aestuariiviva]
MKLLLLAVGPTDTGALTELVTTFSDRIGRYVPFELECIPNVRAKGADPALLRQKESDALIRRLESRDLVWLLDEKGKEFTSRQFADYLQKGMNTGPKRLVLVIGGAYGFGPELQARANGRISLSRMTFNHQVVRLLAVEQLYRALSILKGDPYHND